MARLIASFKVRAIPWAMFTMIRCCRISGSKAVKKRSRKSISDISVRSPISLNFWANSATVCPLLCLRFLISLRASIPGSIGSNRWLNSFKNVSQFPPKGGFSALKCNRWGVAQSPALSVKKPRADLISLTWLLARSGCSDAQFWN
ncbi:hypothetical protein HHX47_DHR2000966 [Lentinula edodes]|nr:hypothetical protein HHX47_DHR2000966 [Lentinula edodes]